MLRVIIDPAGPDKNLQISEEMADDKEHQNDPGNGDDHFFTDGRAIERGEGSHAAITVSVFALAFNHVPAPSSRHPERSRGIPMKLPLRFGGRDPSTALGMTEEAFA
jgi:hypothetical protein